MAIPTNTSNMAGVNFSDVYVAPAIGAYNYGTSNPTFTVGQTATGGDGSVWVYVKYGVGGSTGLGFVMLYDEDYLATMLTLSNDILGDRVGVAPAAALVDNYGWIQIAGTCDAIQVLASCNPNIALNSTATPGAIDDSGASGFQIFGVYLTTARAASQGNAPGVLTYPYVTSTAGV